MKITFYKKTLVLLLIAFSVNGCVHRGARTTSNGFQNLGEERFFGESKVHRYQLANGLKVLILEDHSAPIFTYQTWYQVGSKDEEKGLTGLAHLFEHMMFKATKNHVEGEFFKISEELGAEHQNAFTSRDYTGYVQSFAKEHLEFIISLESDRMVNLLVNKDSLDKEREVVQNERRFRQENNADGTIKEKLFEVMFKEHSYHWPVIGYEQDLINAKASDCVAFYKLHYAPNKAALVIVGDVNPVQTMKFIEKYYGELKPQPILSKRIPQESKQTAERKETIEIPSTIEKIIIGYHVVDINHRDFGAFEMLSYLLGATYSSRLYKNLLDKGLASGIEAYNENHSLTGVFHISVNLQKGKSVNAVLKIIDQEIDKIHQGDVSEDEIKTAITHYKFDTFNNLESNFNKAQFIGAFETVAGRFSRGLDIMSSVSKLTKKDITRIAKTYLTKENRSVIIGLPKGGKK